MLFRSALAIAILLLAAPAAGAAERVALVIGNGAYRSVASLANPRNDADDIAGALAEAGFEVSLVLDAGRDEMVDRLSQFSDIAAGAEMAVVFFAGHGIEVRKNNFVIPVDARLAEENDVLFEALPLSLLEAATHPARTLSLVILDACRDNPFVRQMTGSTRSIGRGLSLVEPTGRNRLVAFAAKSGTVAADGEGRNSPYTRALVEVLAEPGLELGKAFRRVRDTVMRETGGQQEPALYGSLSEEDIFLVPPLPEPEPQETPIPRDPDGGLAAPDPGTAVLLELRFWETIKDSTDPRDYRDYLATFPNGTFASLAARRIERYARPGEPAVAATGTPEPSERTTRREEPQTPPPAPAPSTGDAVGTEPADAGPAEEQVAVLTPPAETRPEPEPARSEPEPAPPVTLSRPQMRRLQASLNILGFDAGPVDGLMGRRTRGAIRDYRAARGLPVRGDVTRPMLDRLGSEVSAARADAYIAEQRRARQAAREAAERARREREERAPEPAPEPEPQPEPTVTVAEPDPADDEGGFWSSPADDDWEPSGPGSRGGGGGGGN